MVKIFFLNILRDVEFYTFPDLSFFLFETADADVVRNFVGFSSFIFQNIERALSTKTARVFTRKVKVRNTKHSKRNRYLFGTFGTFFLYDGVPQVFGCS
nr:hypothetical protein [Marseillevirus cajuinensis]